MIALSDTGSDSESDSAMQPLTGRKAKAVNGCVAVARDQQVASPVDSGELKKKKKLPMSLRSPVSSLSSRVRRLGSKRRKDT